MGTSLLKLSIRLVGFFLAVGILSSCQPKENSLLLQFQEDTPAHQPIWLSMAYQGDFIRLQDPKGNVQDFQAEYIPSASAYLCYLENEVPSQTEILFTLTQERQGAEDRISWKETDSTLTAYSHQDILSFHHKLAQPPAHSPSYYGRAGHIHPVYAPNGAVVTDGFPAGHTHQHGIFFAWVKTLFKGKEVDFWNQQKQSGDVRLDSLLTVEDYQTVVLLQSKQSYVSLADGPVLSENLTLTVYPHPSYSVWDMSVLQTNISSDTLFLQKHLYGGLGVRGSKYWNQQDSLHFSSAAKFLTSEGLGKDSANHTRPLWTAIFGEIEGDTVGIAAFDHPDNPRFPTPVRVHPTMPYFSIAAPVVGPFHLPPDSTYEMKYRCMSFMGAPDPRAFNKIGAAWSATPYILTSNN